ncbi:MAG: HEAT repeat domain-containing protein [Planctomycetes bacterium]|nr:HEAT repeat domain-containing protein [Planctomycetota bacterium]
MKLYLGTTSVLGGQYRKHGIRPAGPTGEVWFSRSLPVARVRARQLSRQQRGRPAVAICQIDTGPTRRRTGEVRCRGPMVAVRQFVPPEAVCEIQCLDAADAPEGREPVVTAAEVFCYLDSPSPRVRMMGVMMLAGQDTAEALDWICTRLEDPDPRVRLAVAMALRRRGRDACDVLDGMGYDEDPRVRRAVQQAGGMVSAIV